MAKAKRYQVSDGKLRLTLEAAEEGGYIVTSPDDPDVLTQAETLEEAFENARDVIALFKQDRASTGKARNSSASSSARHGVVTTYKPVTKRRPAAPRAS
jgi:predicted RNase H-like HicB family nuclease